MKITAASALLYLCMLLLAAGCADDPPVDFSQPADIAGDAKPAAIRLTEGGHHKAELPPKQTIALDLMWSKHPEQKAHLVQRADGSEIYIRYASGSQAWWDSRYVWLLPVAGDTLDAQQTRYDLRAWHYFSCLPYKLSDPGTHWQTLPDRTVDGRSCAVVRLSFEPGTGDTPKDWFAVFTDREKGLVRAAAYVTTFGHPSAEEAAKTPRMIRYLDYKTVAGIPFAHRWAFEGWQTDSLASRTALSGTVLSGVQFGVGEEVLVVPAAAERWGPKP